MQDFGEQVQRDMHFADGSTGRTMHNRYPVIWHRLSRRILDDWQRDHPERGPIWFFTRAGYSGRPGSAAYEMGNFPGDETTDWSAGSGLRSLAPDMLNRAVGGAFGYTTDIGGYIDFIAPPPNAELFTRWSEWAALTPYFRVHNSASTGTRMPWFYGAETLATWKSLASLHQRALPLIREPVEAGAEDRDADHAADVARRRPSAPGARHRVAAVAAGAGRACRPGGRRGRGRARGQLPARLLGAPGARRRELSGSEHGHCPGAARPAPLLHPLRHPPVRPLAASGQARFSRPAAG